MKSLSGRAGDRMPMRLATNVGKSLRDFIGFFEGEFVAKYGFGRQVYFCRRCRMPEKDRAFQWIDPRISCIFPTNTPEWKGQEWDET